MIIARTAIGVLLSVLALQTAAQPRYHSIRYNDAASALDSGTGGRWITGYYHESDGPEPVSEIPWDKYTHVHHFAVAPGVGVDGNGNGTVSLNSINPASMPKLVAAAHLAGKQAVLTVKDNSSYLKAFAQNTAPDKISSFVAGLLDLVRRNGYDGVDIDWEQNIDVNSYIAFISTLRAALPAGTINVAMSADSGLLQVASISQAKLNQINIMCYDMDRWHGRRSWYNDAIFQPSGADDMSCEAHAEPFLRAGIPAARIGIGIPFYGRRWFGISNALQAGWSGTAVILFNELVHDSIRWRPEYQHYDTQYKAAFLSIPTPREFVTYTNQEQIQNIVSWSRSRGFGGWMTFALEYEYLPDRSGDDRYPLSTTLATAVNKE